MSANNGEWTLVRHKSRPKNTRKNNKINKAAKKKTLRNKILYNFYHFNELPDEIFTMSINANNNISVNDEPTKEPELLDDEYKTKVQRALVDFFRDGYIKNVSGGEPASDDVILDYINTILIRYGIKISGGFILKNMGMFKGNTGSTSIDIDMYLPYIQTGKRNTKRQTTIEIHKLLYDLFDVDKVHSKPIFKYFKVTPRGGQRANFFTKNGIYSVTKYSKGDNAEMDLVQADRNSSPIEIIQRFDLTFCQNWYDGENLWSMDRAAVYKTEPGLLEDTYVPLYLGGNPVTRKRIAKYMKRGFRVKYRDPSSGDFVEITLDDLKNVA